MRVRFLVPVVLAAFAFSGCLCAPSKAGDPCDLEATEDPCPSGFVCEESDEGGRCFVVLGGTCDPDASDAFCAEGSACAGAGPVCGGASAACELGDQNCAQPLVCDPIEGQPIDSAPGVCAPPLVLRGAVIDAETRDPIMNADVLALDALGVAVTRVATTDEDGRYQLRVPAVRGDDGAPLDAIVTLRAAARDHQAFPTGVRTALPIALTDAVVSDDGALLILESSLTSVALLALPANARGRATVSGTVAAANDRAGVLVVVEGAAAPAPTAISDSDGAFRVFNAPTGAVSVRGYAAGLVLEAQSLTLGLDDVDGVVLTRIDAATATVSGSVQIVDAPGSATTSVVLVPASTFSATAARGDVPRGLRAPRSGAPDVNGAFSIEGVPTGTFVVLAAFEDDGLVRDPDPSIAGTQIVTIEVNGSGDQSIGESFKITEALAVRSPGADGPELVDAPPTFVFANDASEDFYRVEVLDSFGAVMWTVDEPAPAGNSDVAVLYQGPALEAGLYYQFRATSFRDGGAISRTEDLRGVFVVAE